MELLETKSKPTNVLPMLAAGHIDLPFINQFKIPANVQQQYSNNKSQCRQQGK